ncbi:MAG: alpha/beta hydrolase [Bdellovibrionota bacterium]
MLQPKGFPSLPKGWVSETETFPSADGKLQLFSVTHRLDPWNGGRVLAVFHGLGEHGGRYLHFPHYLKDSLDGVVCMDHRGHGRSEGLRGHVENFDLFSDDVALSLARLDEHLKKRFGRSEIHVYGHSMGGLIALRTLFLHPTLPIHSASIASPLLGIKVKIPAAKKLAGHALSRLWGSLHMSNEIDPKTISHDPEVVAAYVNDRLVHAKVTPRYFTELNRAIADTVSREAGFSYPLLFMIPTADELVDSDAALGFFRALKHREKQLKTYPGFFHETQNEIGKEQVLGDLREWIRAHRKQ